MRPTGWFVFSITHPCFQTSRSSRSVDAELGVSRKVSAYFDEGYWRSDNPDSVRGKVGDYHRKPGTYLNSLVSEGLPIEKVVEPQASDQIAARSPEYIEVPAVLVARCRRA